MRVVLQRVKEAKVMVSDNEISGIGKGALLLVGVEKQDTDADINYLANKIKNIRIFDDNSGKMNLDIKQVNGEILSVPQFTLYADTRKGNRPGFDKAAEPEIAKKAWLTFNNLLREASIPVKEGQFAANMQVILNNNGPVTILLDSKIKEG